MGALPIFPEPIAALERTLGVGPGGVGLGQCFCLFTAGAARSITTLSMAHPPSSTGEFAPGSHLSGHPGSGQERGRQVCLWEFNCLALVEPMHT